MRHGLTMACVVVIKITLMQLLYALDSSQQCGNSGGGGDSSGCRSEGKMMKHVTYTPGCKAEEMGVGEMVMPSHGAGEVLIKVKYAGVGGTDLAQRNGKFNPQPDAPAHHLVMGLELSGVVEAIGEGVTEVKVGDEVPPTALCPPLPRRLSGTNPW
jgi:hypothetical protein